MKTKKIAFICMNIMLLISLCACSNSSGYDEFDDASEGIIEVQTVRYTGTGTENQYYVLANHQRIKPCNPFSTDEATIYKVPNDCFESYVDKKQNKVLNRLIHVALTDENGNPCKTSDSMEDIFQQIASLEHDLFNIKIFDVSGHYFIYVELNVNWSDPCDIYYYDQAHDRLIKLAGFDNQELITVRILSEERLKELE